MTHRTDARRALRAAVWLIFLFAASIARDAAAAIVAVGAVSPSPITTTGTALASVA